jgi:predicted GNAT family N-acyltransferase
MRNDVEIVAGKPAEFSDAERATFVELVRAGDEVDDHGLEKKIANAHSLVFLRQEGQVRGIAAVKRPLPNYRKRIGRDARVELSDADFPYELGYIFIVPEARGHGLSGSLVAKALELVPDSGVFATARIDNQAVCAALRKAGFGLAGEPYGGRGSRTLQIFVKQA